ncbi:hypothetical protein LAZ67_3004002 [Cordylochernes scorpioides]|uniref:Transposase n=1 Tax=Cordylochernes scorpioides TaxID=51811 RepID=A0ABY6KAT5_9ARAC|nr:hypothetical protein LAZ67_3004002 [Cordylochernes scorpioides]
MYWWWCLVHSIERRGVIFSLVSHISEFPVHGYRSGSGLTTPYFALQGSPLLVLLLPPATTIETKRLILKTPIKFHQDNARPPTSYLTLAKIAGYEWTLMPHPAYSPDLAPSDFYLFEILKVFLHGRTFESNVQPLSNFPDTTISLASGQLVQQHAQELAPCEQILMQAVSKMETDGFAADSNMSTDLLILGEEPLLRSINRVS